MWKGAGAPEENVMDDGEGTYVPDNPKTSEVTFRKQEPEKNLYDDQDEDVRPLARQCCLNFIMARFEGFLFTSLYCS